ncbi:MAG: hypothetical protein Q8K52_12250 [Thiobacillus sp.]|nr:hypothetical protein [Thiobacillus sp.]
MRLLSLTLLALWGPIVKAAELTVDTDTGLSSWQTEQAGIQVRLTQISPDQARAFYIARGFSAAATERYVAECVFMTVVRNVGETPIQHRLADWRYVVSDQPPQSIRSKTEWERIWKKLGVKASARIAFTWAQIPSTQTFAPGDWNQGMTTYSVPRDTAFVLRFVWRADGKTHSGLIENVRCSHE